MLPVLLWIIIRFSNVSEANIELTVSDQRRLMLATL